MSINPFCFEQLIAPVSPSQFFDEYWEKKSLVLGRKMTKGYDGLICLKDVEFLISTLTSAGDYHESKIPWVRFINNKKLLNVDDYLKKNEFSVTSLLDVDKVLAGFYQGNTIVLSCLQFRWEPVRKLCYLLQEELGHPISANLYLTPPNSQGFTAHYDLEDVFILQLEGEKIWKIYEPQAMFPLRMQGESVSIDTPNPLVAEITLQPGDILYIPRGHAHEAATSHTHSMHLTVSVMAYTWVDLLRETAIHIPQLRQALPPKMLAQNALSTEQTQFLKTHIQEALDNEELLNSALQGLKRKFAKVAIHPFNFGLTEAIFMNDQITETSLLKKREGISVKTEETHILISFGGRAIKAPLFIEPLLKHIVDSSSFSIHSLPDLISLDEKKILIQRLIKAGFIHKEPIQH